MTNILSKALFLLVLCVVLCSCGQSSDTEASVSTDSKVKKLTAPRRIRILLFKRTKNQMEKKTAKLLRPKKAKKSALSAWMNYFAHSPFTLTVPNITYRMSSTRHYIQIYWFLL